MVTGSCDSIFDLCYQTLAVLFKKKRHLLNSHILHLTFSLVGTVDSGRETTVIPNKQGFEDILCDLEVLIAHHYSSVTKNVFLILKITFNKEYYYNSF